MGYVKWAIVIIVVGVLGAIMHYSLPRHDVVRVSGVEVRLETFGINRFFFSSPPPGMGRGEARDMRYIETFTPQGRERVFRNEDTGWGWPPYFKFDAADLHARTRNDVSSQDDPRWMAVTYYGFRSLLFSIYPNVIRMQPVDSPDHSVIPWSRIIGFTALFAFGTWLWLTLRRFRERKVDPFIEEMGERRERARGWLGRTFDRFLGR